ATPSSRPTSFRSRSSRCCCWRRWWAPSCWRGRNSAVLLNEFLLLGAALFAIGVYGVLARRNGVMVLMSIELILNAVNINFVAFGALHGNVVGQVFALFVITVAAAEVAVGLAIVLLLYRNRASIDLDEVDAMRG